MEEAPHFCRKTEIIAELKQDAKHGKEHREEIKTAITDLSKKFDSAFNGDSGGVFAKMKIQENDMKYVKIAIEGVKKDIAEKLVTKESVIVGSAIGTKIWRVVFTALKIVLWAVVTAVILAGGGYLPLF